MRHVFEPLMRALRGGFAPQGGDSGALRRRRDRFESAFTRFLLVAVLFMAPIAALQTGSATYAEESAKLRQEAREYREVRATLLESTYPAVDPWGGNRSRYVRVPAAVEDGTARPETVEVVTEPGHRKGEEITVWLDRSGDSVEPPLTPAAVTANAWTSGVGMLVLTALGGVLLRSLLRNLMVRTALPAWQREWDRVGPDWTR